MATSYLRVSTQSCHAGRQRVESKIEIMFEFVLPGFFHSHDVTVQSRVGYRAIYPERK
jgi:hypothetical protein